MKKILSVCFIFSLFFCFSQRTETFAVNGAERQALIFEPSIKSAKIPVVFVFHGHGGNARFASRKINFQDYYKEALVIFMQGIPGRTSIRVDPKGVMNGWQFFPNDLGNRDVLFFDEVLAKLHQNYTIDDDRIYVVGHSNGARFVNVLWKERPEKIAAIISVAAQGGFMVSGAKPISVWMSMGKKDPLVSFESQVRSVPIIQKNLAVNTENLTVKGDLQIYKAIGKTELVLEQRNSGHEFPENSLAEMTDFLKRNQKYHEER